MDQKKEKKGFREKLKNLNPKKMSRVLVVTFVISAMIFATIVNLTFKSFDVGEWGANALIMAGLSAFGIIIGEDGGLERYHEKENGVYMRNVQEYNAINKQLEKEYLISGFDQWYESKIPEMDLRKKVKFLVSKKMKRTEAVAIAKYCKYDDFAKMKEKEIVVKDENGKDFYIDKLAPEHYDCVEWVLSGKLELNDPGASFYTTLFFDDIKGTVEFEEEVELVKKRKRVKNLNRIVKIASGFIISAVWAFLTVRDMMKGDDYQAYMNLFSRIANIFISIYAGNVSGKAMGVYDSRIIKGKYNKLFKYYNDVKTGKFIVKDEQEILKNKYDKQVEKEKEHLKNVIDPSKDTDKVEIIQQKPKALENKSNRIELKK